jgi:lipid-binding SYLF domain-containing protein
MSRHVAFTRLLLPFVFGAALLSANTAFALDKAKLNSSSKSALNALMNKSVAAKELNAKAAAVLVFPSITKAGLMVGGQYGEGVLWKNGKPVGYYSTAGASYGMQIGAQKYGYAMFFMKEDALKTLDQAEGFEVGVGPSIVVMDEGMAKSHTSNTLQKDIYAFIFSQKGLMAGLGLQGNKITNLEK